MPTELKRFTEAYATMTVATYEPLVLKWVSYLGIRFTATMVASRMPKAMMAKYDGRVPTVMALNQTVKPKLPGSIDMPADPGKGMRIPIDIHGQAVDPELVKPVKVKGYPRAVSVGGAVYLHGHTAADLSGLHAHPELSKERSSPLVRMVGKVGQLSQTLKQIPLIAARRMGRATPGFAADDVRLKLEASMHKIVSSWANDGGDANLMALLRKDLILDGIKAPIFWPFASYELLSPIGVAHYYRQLYFHKEEGVGPIEEAFTIAPLETLEVVYQSVRKQTHEEVLEQGFESVSESAVEEKNLDEVSDKVSSMVQQDASASMSANASGSVGVWQMGASASASFSVSAQNSRELSTKRLKELTTRASERITKTFSIKTRDVTEVTTTNMTRRVIRNDSDEPVSYGLRRVLRRVLVKTQDLGPRLVWQLYLRNPGEGLALSRFVHFRESTPIAVPDIPPGVPPRPTGGSDVGSISTSLLYDGAFYYVAIVIKPGADRDVTGVRIDSITDLEGGGKEDEAPAPHNEIDLGSSWDPAARTYTAKIAIRPGDSLTVMVNYTYTFNPSQQVLDAWEAQRLAAWTTVNEAELTKQFEKHKQLITERSKIKARPANDLRREERYEVMNRMVSYLFGRGDDPSEPTPLEIEQFHRYFDIDAMFTYNHPSWWKPRFSAGEMGWGREAYEVTAESEPAALGSSLGWLMQLDGDRRRNEFLNSAWARICLPMKPGLEREAIAWLADHLEGSLGYNTTSGPLKKLLDEVEAKREKERALGTDGPDYVTVDSTPGAPADPAKPEGVYPIIDEFEVTIPTEGFVYDELTVMMP